MADAPMPQVPSRDDDPLAAASTKRGTDGLPRVPGVHEPDFDALELLGFLNRIGVAGPHREWGEPFAGHRNGLIVPGYIVRTCPRCLRPFIIGKGRYGDGDAVCGGAECLP